MNAEDVLDDALRKSLPAGIIAPLTRALDFRRCQLRLEATLDGGFTDARVFVVLISGGEQGAGKMILKIAPVSDHATEADVHAAACAADPEFATQHLVDQPLEPIELGNGWTAMFQSIAGGSLSECQTLSSAWIHR